MTTNDIYKTFDQPDEEPATSLEPGTRLAKWGKHSPNALLTDANILIEWSQCFWLASLPFRFGEKRFNALTATPVSNVTSAILAVCHKNGSLESKLQYGF